MWRLQTELDPECRFFRQMVRGKDTPSAGSMQGTYVFAPSGRLLARNNTNDVAVVLRMLREALERWKGMSPAERDAAPETGFRAERRWEDSYPEGGLVLMRWARDLPRSPGAGPESPRSAAVNRDSIWFSAAEARSLVPEALEVGAERLVPAAMTRRLAQFHLVDNVRGQTLPYHPSEVRGALRSKVLAVTGDRVEVSITGWTEAVAKGPWLFEGTIWNPNPKHASAHSMRCDVRGTMEFDRKRGVFTGVSLFASGARTGFTRMNLRGAKDPGGRVGFAMRLAPKAWRVPPTFVMLYGVDWVRPIR